MEMFPMPVRDKSHNGVEIDITYKSAHETETRATATMTLGCRIERRYTQDSVVFLAVTSPCECVVLDPSKAIEVGLFVLSRKVQNRHVTDFPPKVQNTGKVPKKKCKTVRRVLSTRRKCIVKTTVKKSAHDERKSVLYGDTTSVLCTLLGPGVQLWVACSNDTEAELRALCVVLGPIVGERLEEYVKNVECMHDIGTKVSGQMNLIKATSRSLNKLIQDHEESEKEYECKKKEVDTMYCRLRNIPAERCPTLETDQFLALD